MHKWAKSLMECVKTKVDGIGIDNFDMEKLCELEKWVCIGEKIAEYDYYYNIVKAMEESGAEYGVDYDERGKFDEKKYYSRPRDSRGRYMRRGYESDDMMPSDYEYMTENRDMDRNMGKMYYSEPMSRYENAKRHYTETKMSGSHNEQEGVHSVESIANVITDDVKELMPKMSPSERTMLKQKLMNTANML